LRGVIGCCAQQAEVSNSPLDQSTQALPHRTTSGTRGAAPFTVGDRAPLGMESSSAILGAA
jgi:hypothetical protein